MTKTRHLQTRPAGQSEKVPASSLLEDIIEKKLEDISTVLCSPSGGKNRVYEDIVLMVERSLFKIALRRCNHVKSAAAAYLGMNRNTFQRKMAKLGLAKLKKD
jgi:DNA-binding protein Fis